MAVQRVDISKAYVRDFVLAVRSQLDAHDKTSRIAVLVTGIDSLIYRPDAESVQELDARPPFVARLNFDRERISLELPFPLVLWLEKEAFALLLREAPDLTHWISAHFDFGGVSPVGLNFFKSVLQAKRMQLGETPDVSFSDEESVLRELEKIPVDGTQDQLRKRLLLLMILAQKYALSSEGSEVKKSVGEGLRIAKRLDDKDLEGHLRLVLGSHQMSSGKPKLATKEFELALQCANQTHNTGLASRSLLELGKARLKTSPTRALPYLEQARQAAASAADKQTALNVLTQLADAYSSTGETEKALGSLEEAFSIAQEMKDLRQEAGVLMRIGDLLTNEPLKAIAYYERCQPIVTRLGDRVLEAQCLLKIASAYVSLGEFRRAISYAESSLAIATRLQDRSIELHILNAIALAYVEVGETTTARNYWERSVSRAREAKDSASEAEALLGLSQAFSALGEKEKAIKAAKRSLKIFRQSKKPSQAKEAEELLNQLEETNQSPAAPVAGHREL